MKSWKGSRTQLGATRIVHSPVTLECASSSSALTDRGLTHQALLCELPVRLACMPSEHKVILPY
jgi:hypothetical protein